MLSILASALYEFILILNDVKFSLWFNGIGIESTSLKNKVSWVSVEIISKFLRGFNSFVISS